MADKYKILLHLVALLLQLAESVREENSGKLAVFCSSLKYLEETLC